jgi:hypothetical protein
MTRFALLLPALLLPALLVASPLAAQDQKTVCATSADIVDSAVEARRDGVRQRKAIRTIGNDLAGDAAPYKAAVEPIVNWVYTLEDEQMSQDVAAAYEKACLAQ